MTHVVVVGAGLLGSAVAWNLARTGARVTVVGGRRPASGTSGSTFAWANAQDKSPVPYFELNAAGVREYAELTRTLGSEWYFPGGDLLVGTGDGIDKVQAKVDRHRELGYPVETLDRGALRQLEPGVDPGEGEVLVAHFTAESWIAVPLLVGRMIEAAGLAGADLRIGSPVEGFDVEGGRVTAVRAGGDRIAADIVVLAAGPDSDALAQSVGAALPMSPSPGLLVVTAPLASGLRHIVHARGAAIRPDGGGRILLSSRAVDETLDASVRSLDVEAPEVDTVRQGAAAVLPAVRDARIESVRVGVRSVPSDGQPAIGYLPGFDNLYALVTHSGVSLGALLGRLVAAELTGGPVAELESFRPTRFAGAVA
jgi:glycine/D-amino acid oxidase-like deaminating enzyme